MSYVPLYSAKNNMAIISILTSAEIYVNIQVENKRSGRFSAKAGCKNKMNVLHQNALKLCPVFYILSILNRLRYRKTRGAL